MIETGRGVGVTQCTEPLKLLQCKLLGVTPTHDNSAKVPDLEMWLFKMTLNIGQSEDRTAKIWPPTGTGIHTDRLTYR